MSTYTVPPTTELKRITSTLNQTKANITWAVMCVICVITVICCS